MTLSLLLVCTYERNVHFILTKDNIKWARYCRSSCTVKKDDSGTVIGQYPLKNVSAADITICYMNGGNGVEKFNWTACMSRQLQLGMDLHLGFYQALEIIFSHCTCMLSHYAIFFVHYFFPVWGKYQLWQNKWKCEPFFKIPIKKTQKI